MNHARVLFVVVAIVASWVSADNDDQLKGYNEQQAKQFVNQMCEEVQEKDYVYSAKQWDYYSLEAKDQNAAIQAINAASKDMATVEREKYQQYVKIPWKSYHDEELHRYEVAMIQLRDLVLPHETMRDLLDTQDGINKLDSEQLITEYKAGGNAPKLKNSDIKAKLKSIPVSAEGAEELKHYWTEVHNNVASKTKQPFEHIVDLRNQAARLQDQPNSSTLDQAQFEIDNFENTMNTLYEGIKELHQHLHAYIRHQLWKAYGEKNDIIDPNGPIPASLLGWKWGSEASQIFDVVAPFPNKPLLNITQGIKASGQDVKTMGKKAQEFYTSMGLNELPKDFWDRSVLQKKEGLICNPNVYTFKEGEEKRIRLIVCADTDQEGHVNLHDYVGYSIYTQAAQVVPYFFRKAPNNACDIAFSNVMADFAMAPDYLKHLGTLDQNFQPDYELTIKTLLREAMENVFFLPFALAYDQWRWKVVRNEITPEQFNCKYWEMRVNLQGVQPPVDRTKDDFDPGARVPFIAGNEHIKFYIAEFLKIEIIRGLCKTSGRYDPQKPLVFCDIFGSKEVGDKLKDMMAAGASKPWYESYGKLTGSDGKLITSDALMEYYAPLLDWLKTQNGNNGAKPGWSNNTRCK